MSTVKNSTVQLFLSICAFICPLFFIAVSLISPQAKISSDFMVSFYVAGTLVLRGQIDRIYPPAGCLSWKDSPINDIAHELLPALPPELTANFMYSPLVARLLAPWAMLPPALSISSWQLFNLVLLILSAVLARKTFRQDKPPAPVLAIMLFFAPVLATIWVGQVSVLFAVLPLAAAAFFSKKRQDFVSGLCLAILSLKPQFLIAAIFYLVFLPAKKTAAGFLCGLSILAVLTALAAPPETLNNWIHSLSLSEQFMGGQAYTMEAYLAASIPSAFLLQLPSEIRASSHWFIYASAILLASVFPIVLYWKRRDFLRALPEPERICLALWAACLSEIIASPRLILYDTSMFIVPLLFLYGISNKTDNTRPVFWTIVSVNVYVFACLFCSPSPFVLLSLLTFSSLAAVRQLLKSNSTQ